MNKITNFILSKTEPPKESGWLKPLDDGSYGMYVFSNKGWTYVGKSKESVTAIKVNGEDIVDSEGVADLQVVKKPRGYVKVYAPNGSFSINGTKYTANGITTVYVDEVETIEGNELKLELHYVKLKNAYFCKAYDSSVVLDNVDASGLKVMSYMATNLTSLEIKGVFDISNVTDMSTAFNETYITPSIDVSSLNTSNVTNMNSAFSNMYRVKAIEGISNLDTHNVEDMNGLFFWCKNYLTSLDLSKWNTEKVKNMSYMFAYCNVLETLDISGFNTSNVEHMNYLFFSDLKCPMTTLTLGENFGRMKDAVSSVDFSKFISWTNDSVQTLTKLYDRKANGMGVITLRLSSATKASLGEAGITTLTKKGYTIA